MAAINIMFALWAPQLQYALDNNSGGFKVLLPMIIVGGASFVILMQVPAVASGLAGGVQLGTLRAVGWSFNKARGAIGMARPQATRGAYRSVRRDAIAMRAGAKGERLERAGLTRIAPIAGYLNVHQRFDHWARRDVYVATLTRGEFASTEQLLPTLDQVRISNLTGNDFVLLGLEDLSHRRLAAVYPQAWWCHVRPERSIEASWRHPSTQATRPSLPIRKRLSMDKLTTRADIDESLRPRRGQRSDELPALDALEATLKGLASGEIRCDYAIRYAATSMGYLLADCPEQAAWAARQTVALYALPPAARQVIATELLVGLARLRAMRQRAKK